MGSVWCCVDDKKDYSMPKDNELNKYQEEYVESVSKFEFKQPLNKHD